MKPTPISEIIRRIRPLSPFHKACHLRAMIASERKHSIRRVELEAELKYVVNQQLKKELRAS
jgi:hypothetical protein